MRQVSKISQIYSLLQIASRLCSMNNKLYGLGNSGYMLMFLCLLSRLYFLLLTLREMLKISFNSPSHQYTVVLRGIHKVVPQAEWMPSKHATCWSKCLQNENPALQVHIVLLRQRHHSRNTEYQRVINSDRVY